MLALMVMMGDEGEGRAPKMKGGGGPFIHIGVTGLWPDHIFVDSVYLEKTGDKLVFGGLRHGIHRGW